MLTALPPLQGVSILPRSRSAGASYLAVPVAGFEANIVLLERVAPFSQMTSLVWPAVDLLLASSIAITVMTFSPNTPYTLV